jgi:RNAse (barnase) inhibitor barstar
MGRNTTSLRAIVNRYTERIKKLSELLPPDERKIIEEFLRDLDSTLSLCVHTGVEDPLEVLFIHFLRLYTHIKKNCCNNR